MTCEQAACLIELCQKVTGNASNHYLAAPVMNKVYLKRRISRRIADGHPWIFNNEVEKIEGGVNGGETVDVFTHDKKFVGRGYINPKSQILVRLLTREKSEQICASFFLRRIEECWKY